MNSFGHLRDAEESQATEWCKSTNFMKKKSGSNGRNSADDAKIDKVLALFIIIIIISVITRDDYTHTHIYTAADPCEP